MFEGYHAAGDDSSATDEEPSNSKGKKIVYNEQMEQSNYDDDLQGGEEHKASHPRKNNKHSLLLPNNKGENHQTIQNDQSLTKAVNTSVKIVGDQKEITKEMVKTQLSLQYIISD